MILTGKRATLVKSVSQMGMKIKIKIKIKKNRGRLMGFQELKLLRSECATKAFFGFLGALLKGFL